MPQLEGEAEAELVLCACMDKCAGGERAEGCVNDYACRKVFVRECASRKVSCPQAT